MIGKIKWYNPRKRYGFIEGDDGNSYFIHESNITVGREYLGFDPEDKVTFLIGNGRKGEQAERVRLADAPVPEPDQQAAEGEREGSIRWYDLRKNYGFIETEGNKTYFVHQSCIDIGRTYVGFEKGDPVMFDSSQGSKGLQALNVTFAPASE